jgi:hypothetical protein
MTVVRKCFVSCTAAALFGASTAPVWSTEASDFAGMVGEGTAKVDLRYRFEGVDQDGKPEDAEAHTLRSRLTLASASYKGFSFLGEFDDVTHLGDDDFNSTDNGNSDYPIVADPEGTAINQAWLKYAWNDLSGTYGRQRVLHGSQRFIGGVAWRQNEQTYDGLRARWRGGPGLSVDYSYVYKVNRIFGPDDTLAQPGDFSTDDHFLRIDWSMAENHTLSAFTYLLDIDEEEGYDIDKSADNSTDTYGLEYAGVIGPVSVKAAYATQENAGDSTLDYEADYYFAEAGITLWGVKATAAYEVLGADDGVGFRTPYATLHKFQGWADMFLATPADGIEDAYLGLAGEIGPVKLGAFYHDFQAEDSSADFGSEIDLVAPWPVNDWLTTQLKFASFDTDDEARYADTDKLWVTVQVKL